MTLQELIRHAEETGKAVLASTMTAGQMAVVLRWGLISPQHDASPGALVVRTVEDDHNALMTVKPSHRGYPALGGSWSHDQLNDVSVLIVEPEFPFEVLQ